MSLYGRHRLTRRTSRIRPRTTGRLRRPEIRAQPCDEAREALSVGVGVPERVGVPLPLHPEDAGDLHVGAAHRRSAWIARRVRASSPSYRPPRRSGFQSACRLVPLRANFTIAVGRVRVQLREPARGGKLGAEAAAVERLRWLGDRRELAPVCGAVVVRAVEEDVVLREEELRRDGRKLRVIADAPTMFDCPAKMYRRTGRPASPARVGAGPNTAKASTTTANLRPNSLAPVPAYYPVPTVHPRTRLHCGNAFRSKKGTFGPACRPDLDRIGPLGAWRSG